MHSNYIKNRFPGTRLFSSPKAETLKVSRKMAFLTKLFVHSLLTGVQSPFSFLNSLLTDINRYYLWTWICAFLALYPNNLSYSRCVHAKTLMHELYFSPASTETWGIQNTSIGDKWFSYCRDSHLQEKACSFGNRHIRISNREVKFRNVYVYFDTPLFPSN